jgi:DNA-directed RNA polymerase specialized sigma subunit
MKSKKVYTNVLPKEKTLTLDLYYSLKNNGIKNIASIIGISPMIVSRIITNEFNGKIEYHKSNFLLIESKLNNHE